MPIIGTDARPKPKATVLIRNSSRWPIAKPAKGSTPSCATKPDISSIVVTDCSGDRQATAPTFRMSRNSA